MINNKKIAVVVPSYNEEGQILSVLTLMPDFVDRIVVVNDRSGDRTAEVVLGYIQSAPKASIEIKSHFSRPKQEKYNQAEVVLHENLVKETKLYTPSVIANQAPDTDRVILINHKSNAGVGAAIAQGYKWCLDHQIDCVAVMAGDGQMDPSELESIVRPVIDQGVDYVKGNRLIHRSAWLVIPKIRYFGNSILSILTKIASGYWRISDTQCGYTAISLKALQAIRIHKIYKKYGMPNDMLVKLNIAYCTIREVEIKPIYGVGEHSKMNILKVIPVISALLFRSFFKRLWIKYLFRDFHPLFLFYNFSFVLALGMIPYSIKIIGYSFQGIKLSYETLMMFIFLSISCFQFLFFAMWMDIQDNERLYR